MKKQRILSLLLSLSMVFSLLSVSTAAVDVKTFEDVSKDAWYYKYVDFVAEKEYFVGTSKTTFSPAMPMTRAMFVTVLAAIEDVKVNNNVSPFADVPANTWYSGAVAWAAEKGVVAGVGNNKFDPNTPISREQMAVMMNAYVKWTGKVHDVKSKVEGFKDADKISSWAKDAVEACRNWGLVAGMPDGNFWPANTASRAEVATVIKNLAFLVGGGGDGGSSYTETDDYIYNAVESALAQVLEDLKDEDDVTVDGDSATYTYEESFITVDGISVSKAGLAAKDARPIVMDATLNVESGTLSSIMDEIVEYASKLAVILTDPDAAKAEIEKVIDEVSDELGVELSVEGIKDKADEIYEDLKGYTEDIWHDYFIVDGKYITDDITVSAGDATATLIVDIENDNAWIKGDDSDAAWELAEEIAKDLSRELEAISSYTKMSEITLDATIDVTFSAGEYADNTDKYSYEYPLTVNMALAGDVAEDIFYKYDDASDEHYVKLKLTHMAEDYAVLFDNVIDAVSDVVMDEVTEEVLDELKVDTNIKYDGMDLDIEGLKAELDNLKDLHTRIPTKFFNDQMEERGYGFMVVDTNDPNKVYTPKELRLLAMTDYAKAFIADSILGETRFMTDDIEDAFQKAMKEMPGDELRDLADDAGVDVADYETILDEWDDMKDFEYAKDAKLEGLADALRHEFFKDCDYPCADGIVDLVKELPRSWKITIEAEGQTMTISKASLANIRNAVNDGAVYEALAELLDNISELSLSSFEEENGGVKVTANGVPVNMFMQF